MKKGEAKMKNEEIMSTLSEGTKQKLADCKTQEEMKQILAEAGVEPLDDELLDAVAGGGFTGFRGQRTLAPVCESYQAYLP